MIKNPWINKQLRSMYDSTLDCYWFSVIDLCAILTDSDHKKARGYWKMLKHRSTNGQLVTESNHLKFRAGDSKYYFTEVLDFKNLVNLIQTCPSPKANTYRLWLASTLLAGTSGTEIEKNLASHGQKLAEHTIEKYTKNAVPYERLHVVRESGLLNQGS